MKKSIIGLVFILISLSSYSQIRWPFGNANVVTNQVNDTVDISSDLTRGLNYYTVTNDTSMVINATTEDDSWDRGDLLIIEFTEGTSAADTLRYGTNITGTYDAVPSGKTIIVSFVWNETAWVKLSKTQID